MMQLPLLLALVGVVVGSCGMTISGTQCDVVVSLFTPNLCWFVGKQNIQMVG